MRRLYYNCPLQAAYMSKEFQIKFVCRYTLEDNSFEEYDFQEDWFLNHLGRSLSGKEGEAYHTYYVHKNSVNIFEAHEGDLIMRDFTTQMGTLRIKNLKIIGNLYYFDTDDNSVTVHEKGFFNNTLQRDGKMFFTPKVGE